MKILTNLYEWWKDVLASTSDFFFPASYPPPYTTFELGQRYIGLHPCTQAQQDRFYELYIKQFKYEAREFQEKRDIELELDSETCQ